MLVVAEDLLSGAMVEHGQRCERCLDRVDDRFSFLANRRIRVIIGIGHRGVEIKHHVVHGNNTNVRRQGMDRWVVESAAS